MANISTIHASYPERLSTASAFLYQSAHFFKHRPNSFKESDL